MRFYWRNIKQWLQLLILSSVFVTTFGGCSFPSDWTGRWYQSDLTHVFTVNTSYFEYKGECVEKDNDKYIVTNERVEKEPCKRCLAVYKRHDNVIQYKESLCLQIDSLEELCHEITGDQPLLTMFRAEDVTTIPCPFKSPPYQFSYNRGTGDCSQPYSRVDSCTDDSRLLMKFAACPDIHGTEHGEEELNCIATWKEGSSRYLVAKIKSKSNQGLVGESDIYRCFIYDKPGAEPVYRVAQSGDATCNGVTSSTEGSQTMVLTRLESSHEKCKFPSWVVDHHHWHSLDNDHSYHFSHKNATLRIKQEHGPTEMRLLCHHVVSDQSTVTIVAHATAGCKNGYICIVFHKRDSGVIQVQKSNEMTQEQSEACVPPFTDPYHMSKPVTLVTVSPPLQRCPRPGRYAAQDPTCHANTSLLIGCSTSPQVITLQTCSPDSATAYHCHGSWSENQTTYIIASPVSRKSTDAKRYCFILKQVDGLLTLHRLTDSCNLSASDQQTTLNLTLQGSCVEDDSSKDSSAMILPSLLIMKMTLLLNALR